VARALGLPQYRWHNDLAGGGSQCASILGDAAMAIEAGVAETIVIYRALNGRSGKRMGQIGLGAGDDGEAQFLTPYGFRGPLNLFALVAQRYAAERGLTPEDMAALAVQQRASTRRRCCARRSRLTTIWLPRSSRARSESSIAVWKPTGPVR